MAQLTRDGWLVLASKGTRSFGYGFLSVILGLYLDEVGFSPVQVGFILTATLVGSALLTGVVISRADRLGRRRMLMVSSGLMALSGIIFAVAQAPWLLLVAALTGTISPTSGEVGPFETIEAAILPQTASEKTRNRAFGLYNAVGAAMVALGALAAAIPATLSLLDLLASYRLMFMLYAALGIATFLAASRLSPKVELARLPERASFITLTHSRGPVLRLAGLFAVDSFAGGFVVQSLLVYWFSLRFGVGAEFLGPLFFGVNVMKSISYLLAVRIADRIGLLNTMVFSHLPSNVLLIMIPLMPSLTAASAVLLARHLLSQMDVPTRASYIVAVVKPEERTSAVGVTTLSRTLAHAFGPVLAGAAISVARFGFPFFVAGGLKIAYDLALYFSFREHKPPEERD
ncbi:MAG: MFS transporter [Chloroflexi bacterium]|nr:MFS transporter [Chloroflexota bacterium]MDK1045132.1 MFS transporter [Anaerolineales bacterium]MCH8340221.1 MFS transporter [Chloroflexota bacterium]MCH8875484.1 MFS transporter [Chloroflexota bacterium]MCI0773095.1 MFS transporter [Chloroflexota bacterium]